MTTTQVIKWSRCKTWNFIDKNLDRWHLIKEFVRIINTTEKATIMNGWEKTRLTERIDFDDRILEEPDNEEELLLQDAMEDMMIESDTESLTDDADAENLVQVLEDDQKQDKKTSKQKQITDFFQSQK